MEPLVWGLGCCKNNFDKRVVTFVSSLDRATDNTVDFDSSRIAGHVRIGDGLDDGAQRFYCRLVSRLVSSVQ